MFRSTTRESNQSQVTTPDLEDCISFSDDVNPDVDVDAVDVDAMATKKPHFLDYDAVPPPDFIEHFDRAMSFGNATTAAAGSGEQLKVDKKFEKDGEISDYELAASGYTKKEFTQDDNTLTFNPAMTPKPRKHFLDENPIPPDYMMSENQLREHRSLDRNFERHNEQRSAMDTHGAVAGLRSSRERCKEIPPLARLPKGTAWTQSFDSRYDSHPATDKIDSFGPKVECVYSLLSMLGSNDPLEMAKKFHELSKNTETCHTLRRSGCIPLLVQMIHTEGGPDEPRKWAGMALHNVVHCHPEEKSGRREAKVLRLLDQILDYCNFLRTLLQSGGEAIADDADRHPLAAMSSLMKVSFDEEHRHAMCELGALQAIPSLVHLDHAVHGPKPENQCCNSLRRFALMALTNLTFGDENNKALLCSQKLFMEALVAQLDCAPDDLLQVTASVLRNLSWRADAQMKSVLNEIGTVTALAKAAMKNKCENTLKAILSALWNLSAHCSTNKAEFCAVEGALSFIVCMLTYEGPSKTLKIIENAGGILRNVSSHIAVREDYRQILREHNCLSILLQQLKSESLTVVSNSCGTLWNLSARCPEDQRFLWDNGAVPMLRSLIHSKHAMISEGSACALKNLLNFRPSAQNANPLDPIARSLNLKKLPTLNVRKQKALEQELGAAAKKHSETCDNLDTTNPKDRPTYNAAAAVSGSTALQRHRFPIHVGVLGSMAFAQGSHTSGRLTRSAMLTKSESKDSVFSVKSDGVVYDHLMRSQSASDANRKLHHNPRAPKPPSTYPLERESEPAEEEPIDYSQKYTEHISKHNGPQDDSESGAVAYQETDLDQPTDFSLRYAENQLESDTDLAPSVGSEGNKRVNNLQENATSVTTAKTTTISENPPAGSEILLILEDSVKCYQTEDTPYVISNAASVTDLRSVPTSAKVEDNELASVVTSSATPSSMGANHIPSRKFVRAHQPQPHPSSNMYGSGSYTPEKPVNYCEEGTPGYFSRYESLSSLDESPPQGGGGTEKSAQLVDSKQAVILPPLDKPSSSMEKQESSSEPQVQQPQTNSALETPLMFSRRSSMDSLAEEDIGPLDDKSSVVSEFSRLASGVISPSEIPDSPTQSMPQSPRRNSTSGTIQAQSSSGGVSPQVQRTQNRTEGDPSGKRDLRSVFEDDLNTYVVENTPAQFSTATSLSNLSILDDEVTSTNQSLPQAQPTAGTTTHTISEGEEEDDGNGNNNDDMLLASCINMGMNRSAVPTMYSQGTDNNSTVSHVVSVQQDEPKQYYTEDTPALMSKVGSNTNLSAISICSSNNELKEDLMFPSAREAPNRSQNQTVNRRSLNLSDDMSSNASESGAAGIDILQQCIRDGMQKPLVNKDKPKMPPIPSASAIDPIAMLRRGGNLLPGFIAGNDEMNKYRVEDSPCNFSVMSGLSNLTVGSSLVGPAMHISGAPSVKSSSASNPVASGGRLPYPSKAAAPVCDDNAMVSAVEDVRREQWQDDSLSSLSIESEDDTNLLSQAIAAGCNRPKSNLGFTTNLTSTGKHNTTTSLSSSQPITINAATSASSLTSQATTRHFDKQLQMQHSSKPIYGPIQAGNESYSSVDSSDSNDNQSKSLFELCILTGMHKNRDNQTASAGGGGSSSSSSRKHTRSAHSHRHHRAGHAEHNTTQSNPNLKQFDALPMPGKQLSANRHLRERDRRDEKLLMECINTGIMKKIGESSKQLAPQATFPLTREALVLHNNQPKNGQATSAAAPVGEPTPPASVISTEMYNSLTSSSSTPLNIINTTITTSTTIAAAPDVEKNDSNTISISPYTTTTENSIRMLSQQQTPYNIFTPNTSRDDATRDPRPSSVRPTTLGQSLPDVGPLNRAIDQETMNAIGYKLVQDDLLSNAPSDESNQSFIMETTVTLEARSSDSPRNAARGNEKHKDPDLMLKSVERLTLEFVSSAEQLRINSTSASGMIQHTNGCVNAGASELTHNDNTITSISNDTWDEDTCPNDVSFPSVSMSAPKVASISFDDDDEDQATTADYRELNDFAENTPMNEELPAPDMSLDFDNIEGLQTNGFCSGFSQPSSIDFADTDKTYVNEMGTTYKTNNQESESPGAFHFELGGMVQTAAASSSMFFSANSLTNSTFMAQEARKLANNLQATDTDGEEEELTFSVNSLDLDNIRPPSGMDSLNISGYYMDTTQPNSLQNSPHSPQMHFKSPKFPRKTLPAGLVARRALGHMPPHLTSSIESINSSCNLLLDNIKPPSLMDELLDSMISVASIQSEVVDDCPSLATTVTVSNYETANEGDTITLHSCGDDMMGRDDDSTLNDGGLTPLPSDFEISSVESTPKKSRPVSPAVVSKRTLTPKQKRQQVKDRYRTYTIEANEIASEEVMRRVEEETQRDEILAIEITNYETMTLHTENEAAQENEATSTPRHRRRTSQDRYKTQTITYSDLHLNISNQGNGDGGRISERSADELSTGSIKDMTAKFTFLNAYNGQEELRCDTDQECHSLEFEQNSETESCHNYGKNNSSLTDCEEEQEPEEGEMELDQRQEKARPRIINPNELAAESANPDKNAEEQSPIKVIRGGKKPQYISPYSAKYQKACEPVKQRATKLQTTATKSSVLKKYNGVVAAAAGANTKLAQKKCIREPAKPAKEAQATPPALERQGTFVKDEPSLDSSAVPVVETSPTKSRLSKLPTKKSTSVSNNTSPQRTAGTRKLATASAAANQPAITANRRNFGGSITKPQRANSNVNIRVTTNAARIAVLSSRVSTTTPPSRSNSSLNSGNAAVIAAQNAATKINQVQSRIAGIWRKVDETKGKQPTKGPKTTQQNGKPTGAQQQPGKLIRSTTFDNSPPLTVTQPRAAAAVANGNTKLPTVMGQRTATQRQISVNRK